MTETVALANSDPRSFGSADYWIRRFSRNHVTYTFQYHADQDPDYLVRFWSFGLVSIQSGSRSSASRTAASSPGATWRASTAS